MATVGRQSQLVAAQIPLAEAAALAAAVGPEGIASMLAVAAVAA